MNSDRCWSTRVNQPKNGKNSSNALSMTKRSSPASRHILHGNNRAVTNLQPLLPPDALDPLVVDHPAHLAAQKLGDLAIAVAAIAAGQCDDVLCQLLLVVPAARNTPLRGAMLPKHEAYPALRHALRQNRANMVD